MVCVLLLWHLWVWSPPEHLNNAMSWLFIQDPESRPNPHLEYLSEPRTRFKVGGCSWRMPSWVGIGGLEQLSMFVWGGTSVWTHTAAALLGLTLDSVPPRGAGKSNHWVCSSRGEDLAALLPSASAVSHSEQSCCLEAAAGSTRTSSSRHTLLLLLHATITLYKVASVGGGYLWKAIKITKRSIKHKHRSWQD